MAMNLWRDIRSAIEQDIRDGLLETGAQLPTEPELARRYAAGRHSVRRAIAELAKDGLLSVEQGRGTFVRSRPRITYSIGARTRLRQNLQAQEIAVTGASLGVEYIAARARVADALSLPKGAPVIATHRITYADGVPVAMGTLFHDATRFPDFPEQREAAGSVTAAYQHYGISDYLRLSTQIFARPPRGNEAAKLDQHPDMPVVILRAIDAEPNQRPLAYSEVVWSSARVKFDIPGGI